ncbi:hypothetical protein GGR54DRAFT_634465 [Hypoxylon sp. NC1633]|nr:hypothetical protein GGR54DRAFT_634465 [Hypoxylon sp. NC1633]
MAKSVTSSPVSPPTTDSSVTVASYNRNAEGPGPCRLTVNYPAAHTDFYGCSLACIYKSGPAWPSRVGHSTYSQPLEREVRPVYAPDNVENWRRVGRGICQLLDNIGAQWTFINPLAYANAGEAEVFCPFVVVIGVKPHSLSFNNAVTVANSAHELLATASFDKVEVAVVEAAEVTRSVSRGPKMLSFQPLLNNVPGLRKIFTPTLGIPISPAKYPHYAGTGALFYRMSGDQKRVFLLTCAHVARPPSEDPNTGKKLTNQSHVTEEIISPGSETFDSAIRSLMTNLEDQTRNIKVWNNAMAGLGDAQEGEVDEITEMRAEYQSLVDAARKRLNQIMSLYNEVQDRETLTQRVIGRVFGCQPIKASHGSHGFTRDWALIEIYHDKIDWGSFRGNKVFVGERGTIDQFARAMWPQASDGKDFCCPPDGLLQANGIVQDAEIRNPRHLDVHNQKCLLVVKNGTTTGTTFGRVNGLESFIRSHAEYGIYETSMELAVLRISKQHNTFSRSGDSGSIVLTRTGKILGIITRGEGPTDNTDVTYITPYYAIDEELKKEYPGIHLYPVVHGTGQA